MPTTVPILWPFPPNWRVGVSDSREFRTDILVSRSGREQRRALRTTPRRQIEFTAQVTGDRLRSLIRLMNRQQNRTVLLPDWVYYATTTANATGTTATVDSVPAWLGVNSTVIFFDATGAEVRTVQSVSGNNLTFTSSSRAWPAGTRVYRSLSGLLASDLTASLPSSGVASLPVTFNVRPGSEPLFTPPAPAASLGDYEVFQRSPNWGQSVQSMFNFPINTVDYGRGVTEEFRPIDFGTTTRRGTYYGMSRSDVEALIGTFYRAKGRRGEFYMPTGMNDMLLRSSWAANNALMRVIGNEIASMYADDTVNRAVAIYLNNGAVYYRVVEEIYTITDGLGSDTILRLTIGLPVSLQPADIMRISWMPRHRFGSDSLNITWLTDEVAEIPMAFTSLEHLVGF